MADRKRSQNILLGIAGVGAVALLAYDYLGPSASADVGGNLFSSIDQCAASGQYDRRQCTMAFNAATEAHEHSAPRYASQADCEAEFSTSACHSLPAAVPIAGAAGVFVPSMAGFVIGSGISAALATPVYQTCPRTPGTQDCRSSSGSGFYTGSGFRVFRSASGSSATVSRAAFSAPGSVSSPTLSRGGFGARASAVSARS
jgi:uncharacterized protein YgiB involved in biofilm formation